MESRLVWSWMGPGRMREVLRDAVLLDGKSTHVNIVTSGHLVHRHFHVPSPSPKTSFILRGLFGLVSVYRLQRMSLPSPVPKVSFFEQMNRSIQVIWAIRWILWP